MFIVWEVCYDRKQAKVLSYGKQSFLQTVIFVHKVLTSNAPPYLKSKLESHALIMERCTRQDVLLGMLKVWLEVGKKGVGYVGPQE